MRGTEFDHHFTGRRAMGSTIVGLAPSLGWPSEGQVHTWSQVYLCSVSPKRSCWIFLLLMNWGSSLAVGDHGSIWESVPGRWCMWKYTHSSELGLVGSPFAEAVSIGPIQFLSLLDFRYNTLWKTEETFSHHLVKSEVNLLCSLPFS